MPFERSSIIGTLSRLVQHSLSGAEFCRGLGRPHRFIVGRIRHAVAIDMTALADKLDPPAGRVGDDGDIARPALVRYLFVLFQHNNVNLSVLHHRRHSASKLRHCAASTVSVYAARPDAEKNMVIPPTNPGFSRLASSFIHASDL